MATKLSLGSFNSESGRMEEVLSYLGRMASGEADLRIPLSQNEDMLDAFAWGVNLLAEELTFANQRIEQEREAATRASQAKSIFLANMSHEIRTPLTGILGFLELLCADDVSEQERTEYLTRMRANCHSLQKLINGILELSKVESGELTIERSSISLRDKVTEAANGLEGQAVAKGLRISTKFDPSVPDNIETDPLRLWQILNNLVGNGIKFSSRGEIRIHAHLIDTKTVALDVADSGIGITQTQAEQLFRPFVQGDSSIVRRFGGTGLGLALSRGLCRALGGDLTLLSSIPDVGTTFRVTLPLRFPTTNTVDAATRARRLERHSISPNALAAIRVLLVEDAEDNRLLISTFLRKAGAVVVVCEDGQQALTLVSQGFDVILMDIQMPVLDGITAARMLREQGHTLPIFALTAHALEGEREKCLSLGFSDYLSKPIHWRTLIAKVQAHASRRSGSVEKTALSFQI